MCDMRHSYVWHASFLRVTRLMQIPFSRNAAAGFQACDMTHSYVWHDSFLCVTWLISMCDMTHSLLWHHSLTRVTWLMQIPFSRNVTVGLQMCDKTHSYMWHNSFLYVTRLTLTFDMTHLDTFPRKHRHRLSQHLLMTRSPTPPLCDVPHPCLSRD